MNGWLERNLPDIGEWRVSSSAAPSEDEMAYLFNDIGPLLYAFNSVPANVREETLK